MGLHSEVPCVGCCRPGHGAGAGRPGDVHEEVEGRGQVGQHPAGKTLHLQKAKAVSLESLLLFITVIIIIIKIIIVIIIIITIVIMLCNYCVICPLKPGSTTLLHNCAPAVLVKGHLPVYCQKAAPLYKFVV